MKITIEDRTYEVTELVTKQVFDFIEKKMLEVYNSAPNFVQAAFMVIVRHELANAEKKHPDKRDILRPPKRKDPIEHVLTLAKGAMVELLREETIDAKTNDRGEINALELKGTGAGGGPLVVSGDEWKW